MCATFCTFPASVCTSPSTKAKNRMCRKRDCYSDEHYVPVLMAYLGLDNETTCSGDTMHVSWQSSTGEVCRSTVLSSCVIETLTTLCGLV